MSPSGSRAPAGRLRAPPPVGEGGTAANAAAAAVGASRSPKGSCRRASTPTKAVVRQTTCGTRVPRPQGALPATASGATAPRSRQGHGAGEVETGGPWRSARTGATRRPPWLPRPHPGGAPVAPRLLRPPLPRCTRPLHAPSSATAPRLGRTPTARTGTGQRPRPAPPRGGPTGAAVRPRPPPRGPPALLQRRRARAEYPPC